MPDNAPLSEPKAPYQYWAFISYSSKDRAWARWLHTALETYHLPAQLLEHPTPMGEPAPKRFKPLFWDRAELQAHHHLGELIQRSLQGSRYLIVICSPNSAQSFWVEKEIQTFQQMHGPERILALIIDGEPNAQDATNCFPPTLRAREPKAPDARPQGDGRTNAKLMLLATMLGVPFDRLKRRDQERKIKALGMALTLASVLLACMGWLWRSAELAKDAETAAKKEAVSSVLEAATKAQGLAGEDFDFRHDPRTGFAHLAEALNYNAHLPAEKKLATLHQDATHRLLTQPMADPLPASQAMNHLQDVTDASFSPDGKRIVTASGDHTARLWDVQTGKPVGEPMLHQDSVVTARFSPDGRLVVTASADKTARLWDAATGKALGRPMVNGDYMHGAVFSPDGRRIAVYFGGVVRLWDSAGMSVDHAPISLGGARVNSIDFSPDGRLLVTAGEYGSAELWDTTSGRPVGEKMRHAAGVNSAAFSPDGRYVLTAGKDNTARLWDTTSGQAIGDPMSHAASVNNASFSPDGQLIVTVSDKTAKLWDATSAKLVYQPLLHNDTVTQAKFSPDGQLVITVCSSRAARLWHVTTGKPLGEPLRHEKLITTASFSPDGRHLLTSSDDKSARLWDLTFDMPSGPILRHEGWIKTLSFSPDGQRVVTASWDDTAKVWDALTGLPVGKTLRHGSAVSSARFSPDGQSIVTASMDGTAMLWNASTGELIGEPMRHKDSSVNEASFSPDGHHIVTAGDDDTARLWDAHTGRARGVPLPHEGAVTSACFSPNGQSIVTASAHKTARLWDTNTGKPLGEPMHGSRINVVSFSPDGRHVFTADSPPEEAVQAWEIATGKPVDMPPAADSNRGLLMNGRQQLEHAFNTPSARILDWSDSNVMANAADLTFWAGKKINSNGLAVDIAQDERIAWHSRFLASAQDQGDAWHRLLLWALAPASSRPLSFHSKITAAQHVEREITWALSQAASPKENPALLTAAYDVCPDHPLIHLALAAVQENKASAEFLKSYGLKRLAAEVAASDKAAHHAHAGTYRAKAAVVLALQEDHTRASQVFAELLSRHDPQRQTWGSSAWIEKLDEFEWPKRFRETLARLASK